VYGVFFKRFFDILVSATAILTLSPIILIIASLLIVANSGRPFFIQKRPGRHGRVFSVVKFKSMNDNRTPDGRLLSDRDRLTAIGKFLRSTSLDEVPQLFNVLKGDMSLVGPRPLLISYLSLYSERQSRRHEVKPGITGWAQVNGRNAISWQERFEYDLYYVEHISFWFDFKILWLTLKKVIRREGINSDKAATMEAFKGNKFE
jgi:undecaprenyl phosphate N,N'-diacetylbacillosamine 1-phosphate transferase